MKTTAMMTVFGTLLWSVARAGADQGHAMACRACQPGAPSSVLERELREERLALARAEQRLVQLREERTTIDRCIAEVRIELAHLERDVHRLGTEIEEGEAETHGLRADLARLEMRQAEIRRELAACQAGRHPPPRRGDHAVVLDITLDLGRFGLRIGQRSDDGVRRGHRLRDELRRVRSEIAAANETLNRNEHRLEHGRKRYARASLHATERRNLLESHCANLARVDREIRICRATISRSEARVAALEPAMNACQYGRHVPTGRVAGPGRAGQARGIVLRRTPGPGRPHLQDVRRGRGRNDPGIGRVDHAARGAPSMRRPVGALARR